MEMWMIVAGFAVFFVTFFFGMPIWLCLVLTTITFGFLSGMLVKNIPLTLFGSLDSFLLLAAPFFLLGGNIMARCGPAKYLFEAIDAVVGGIPGGLPFATVLSCMVFAAVTGSTLATLVAVGSITVPPMTEMGYPKKFCLGLMCVSSTLGQIIPPSIYMILYGSYVQVSAARLFLGGMLPGVILGLLIAIITLLITVKNGYEKKREKLPLMDRIHRVLFGIPALLMPFLVLGGIYTGIFTPTEAAAVACVYSILISHFVYHGLTLNNFLESVKGALHVTSMIFFIVASAIIIASPLTFAQIPQHLTAELVKLGVGKNLFLVLSVVLFLFLGLFLDPLPILYLTIPILLYPMQQLGVNLIHFCVITIICTQIAQITPPFGVSLYATSQLWDEPIDKVISASMPFLLILVISLPIFMFIPWLSTWIPKIVMGY